MKDVIHVDLPGFKASYNVEMGNDTNFDSLENIKQVNGLVFNEEGELLIVNTVGNWQLPGGHLKKGETFEDCLRREVDEEADVEISEISPFCFLKISEIKEGGSGPEIIQLKFVAKLKNLKEQTIDPAYNKIPERKFINIEEFTKYVPWGNIGNELVNKARDAFIEGNKSK